MLRRPLVVADAFGKASSSSSDESKHRREPTLHRNGGVSDAETCSEATRGCGTLKLTAAPTTWSDSVSCRHFFAAVADSMGGDASMRFGGGRPLAKKSTASDNLAVLVADGAKQMGIIKKRASLRVNENSIDKKNKIGKDSPSIGNGSYLTGRK